MKRNWEIIFISIFVSIGFFYFSYGIDNDKDGIDDLREIEYLNKHTPKLIFHPDEKERPYRIEDWFCKYQINLEKEEYYTYWYLIPTIPIIIPTERRAAETLIEDIKLTDLSRVVGDSLCLNPVRVKNEFSNSPPYTIYGHCFKTKDKCATEYIELQYWIFYSNNDIRELNNVNIIDKTGAEISKELWKSLKIDHIGDWEFVAIRLNMEWEPQQIYYSAHYPINWTEEQIRSWDDPTVEKDGTHPIVYVARDSHANYFSRGIHKSDIPLLIIDYDYEDKTGFGESCIPQVINLGEKDFPLNGCEWIRYSGKWGSDKGSPKGPVYRDTGGIGSWDGMFVDNPSDIRNWVFFYSVSGGNIKIKIFDKGRLVREIDEGYKEAGREYEYEWDGRDDRGNKCEIGSYLYQVFVNDEFSKSGSVIIVDGKIYPKISYTVGDTKIFIYDIKGKLIRTLDEGLRPSGGHVAVWDAKNEANEDVVYQVYLYFIKTDNIVTKSGKIIPAYLRPYVYDISVSPNVFCLNQTVTLSYKLSEESKVFIKIIDMSGSDVRTLRNGEEWLNAGSHYVIWDGKDDSGNYVPTGIYNYVISAIDRSFKVSVEYEEVTFQVGEETIKYGPTLPMRKKGTIEFRNTSIPEVTNVVYTILLSSLTVNFVVSEPSVIKLKIYDSQNRLVNEIEKFCLKGQNVIQWDMKDKLGGNVSDGMYYFKLVAENLSYNLSDEKSYIFIVGSDFLMQNLNMSPTDNSIIRSTQVTFEWFVSSNIVTDINYFVLQIDDDYNFISPEIDVIISSISTSYTTLLFEGEYYWRIFVYDTEGKIFVSPTYSFLVTKGFLIDAKHVADEKPIHDDEGYLVSTETYRTPLVVKEGEPVRIIVKVSSATEISGGKIYYTTDCSTPTFNSPNVDLVFV